MFSAGSCRSLVYIETKDRESISCNLTQVSSSHRNESPGCHFAATGRCPALTLIACFAAVRAVSYRDVRLHLREAEAFPQKYNGPTY
jgi:hypothetical protein